jgi:hypothetical protein
MFEGFPNYFLLPGHSATTSVMRLFPARPLSSPLYHTVNANSLTATLILLEFLYRTAESPLPQNRAYLSALAHCVARVFCGAPGFGFPSNFISLHSVHCSFMDDIVHLGENSQDPANGVPADVDGDWGSEYVDDEVPVSCGPPSARGASRGRGRVISQRSLPSPSLSQATQPQKVRGPNWTEAEMLVLIAQKRIEWDGRHNSNQPALAKFVYGATTWKLVLAGCMGVVGFRARDTDQITNKWDGLIKDYKKLKDYIDGMGSGNWWGMSREEKKQLSKTRKMSLEFSEAMYLEMEGFVGKRQIFGRATEVVDSDRVPPTIPRRFGRSPPSPCTQSVGGVGSPLGSATSAPESPTRGTPGDDTPGSTGRKRKSTGNDNLVDFVKDFNYEYIARVDAQEKDKRVWRSDILAFDTAREARIAHKDAEVIDMDRKLYELEVERTKNLGNMTSALLMLASSMDALTRYIF